MNLLLIGYGKMGKAIAQVALQRGHQIVHKIDRTNSDSLATLNPATIDVAIEFSHPQAAYYYIYQCLAKNIPVISGTTGWLAQQDKIHQYCKEKKGTFFYATNFSLGMNIFFTLNTLLAKIMPQHPTYKVSITETHHLAKQDAPSGTAITLAEEIIRYSNKKKKWVNTPTQQQDTLSIISTRAHEVPGTHAVTYASWLDTLTIQHTAHSREAFAQGVIRVTEWIQGKKGILSMKDFLKIAD